MIKVKLPVVICDKCSATWTPRQEEVNLCPNCRSPKWIRLLKGKEIKEVKEVVKEDKHIEKFTNNLNIDFSKILDSEDL